MPTQQDKDRVGCEFNINFGGQINHNTINNIFYDYYT